MTESTTNIFLVQRAAIIYKLITLPKQVKKLVPPIDDKLDHSYCVKANGIPKKMRNHNMSLKTKRNNVNLSKIAVDCTGNSIIKEEVIIPDLTEENADQNIYLDTLCGQTNETESTTRDKETPVSVPVNDPIEIISEQYYNQSVLKSRNIQAPLVLKLLNSKPTQNETAMQNINNVEEDKTVGILNTKEKQVVTTDNNYIEIKEEFVEADSEEQTANKNKRFYHVVCLTCKKLKKPDDTNSKCIVCQNTFQYECLRCRDILSSKNEYYNHLKVKEFCPEIQVPLLLKNDSYALATVMERNQCISDVWERAQKLVLAVRKARMKSIDGKFKRIKLCCPICDETFPVDNGNFWCVRCDTSSVFNCQTCNRNYATYCGAIYHTENHCIRKPIYKCYNCSFKHKKKRALFTHIRQQHLPKETGKEKRRNKKAQCPDCNLIITSNSYWMKHKYSCRKKVYFKCTLCAEKYLVKEDMRLHLLAAHEKTDSQVLELIKLIENDRNKQEKIMKQNNQRSLNRVAEEEPVKKHKNHENNNKPKLHYITPYCLNCNKTFEHLKISNANNNCPKCKSTVGVQCKFCQKSFQKYMTAYYHITKKCEKIRKAKLEHKWTEHKLAKENTNSKNISSNNEHLDFIFDDLVDLNNDMENNSTLETTEMHLDTETDIKIENQDIETFVSH